MIKHNGENMIELHKACYAMYMQIGGDAWRIHGRVYGHSVFQDGDDYYPSSPVAFDETNMIVTSISGKKYKIISFADHQQPKDFINQLKNNIEKGYFS